MSRTYNEYGYNAPRPYADLWRDGRWEETKTLARRATELEIAQCLALLLKAFPNASGADGEIFGATLIEDVVSAKPAIGDIQEACKYLRRTSKFVPTIAQVLEAHWEAKQEREVVTRSMAPIMRAIAKPPSWIAHQPTVTMPGMKDIEAETNHLPL
ncbi:hypothetical protein [Nitrobacter sp. JJSN]|uniref:hypothetical protein n=1 Tax=Nitrobacter sp. JJSN TaxID=3453033 RepID=UPI003F770D4D